MHGTFHVNICLPSTQINIFLSAHAGVGPLQSGEKRSRVSEQSLLTELAAYEAGVVFVSDDEDEHQIEVVASTASTSAAAA